MRKETTWRVRAIGTGIPQIADHGKEMWRDTLLNEEPTDIARLFCYMIVRDYELARLETLVNGPLVVRQDEGVTYRRTVIDTREEVLRPWADPGCMARWLRLSEEDAT